MTSTDREQSQAVSLTGGRRALVTVLDQGFSSVSNFVVAVAVARQAGAAGLGGFSVAYAAWLVLASLHRSLVTDPMAIEGDVRHPGQAQDGAKRGFAAEVVLSAVALACFAVIGGLLLWAGQHVFGVAMLALAPWLPMLVIQDYWRWMGFMSHRPQLSLANDCVFNCTQGVALVAVIMLHVHSEVAVISSWGFGGGAGALCGLRQYRFWPTVRGGLALLRERWSMSKWIAGSSVANWGSTQLYMVLVAAILGPAGLGGLKAAQALVAGPSGVLIQAGGSIGLPEATKAYAERGWPGLFRVTRFVTVAGFLSFLLGLAVVLLWGRSLLAHIYGPSFAHLELAAVLFGVAYVMDGFVLGPLLVFKATRQTRWMFYGQVVGFVVSMASMAVLCAYFGVVGAAEATVVTYVAGAVTYRWFQHRAHGSLAQGGPTIGPLQPDGLFVR